MKIEDLFRQLSFGELSNLSISDSGSGLIIEAKHPQLIQYLNDGLLALYSRFMLKEKDILIEQVAHIPNYHLKLKYAESTGSKVPYPYIKDLPDEPFEEDVIRILTVTNAWGEKYTLNDVADADSLFTPQPDVLQVPNPVAGEPLAISYQARHRKLVDDGEDVLFQDIEVPFYLENALRLYVAYKVFSHMNGQENILKSQEYMGTYEATCLDVEARDLVNQTYHTSHRKLEQRGFV